MRNSSEKFNKISKNIRPWRKTRNETFNTIQWYLFLEVVPLITFLPPRLLINVSASCVAVSTRSSKKLSWMHNAFHEASYFFLSLSASSTLGRTDFLLLIHPGLFSSLPFYSTLFLSSFPITLSRPSSFLSSSLFRREKYLGYHGN